MRLLGTVKRKSVLKGTVKQTNASSDGASSLALLSGAQGVNTRSLSAAESRIRLDVLDVAVLDAAFSAALLDEAFDPAV